MWNTTNNGFVPLHRIKIYPSQLIKQDKWKWCAILLNGSRNTNTNVCIKYIFIRAEATNWRLSRWQSHGVWTSGFPSRIIPVSLPSPAGSRLMTPTLFQNCVTVQMQESKTNAITWKMSNWQHKSVRWVLLCTVRSPFFNTDRSITFYQSGTELLTTGSVRKGIMSHLKANLRNFDDLVTNDSIYPNYEIINFLFVTGSTWTDAQRPGMK